MRAIKGVARHYQRPEPDFPVFLVAAGDGPTGRLVADRRAERGGAALVADGEEVRGVEADALRIVGGKAATRCGSATR